MINYLITRLRSKCLIGGSVIAFGIGYSIDKYNKWDTLQEQKRRHRRISSDGNVDLV